MMNMHEMWRRMTATRYTRALEVEVARLRAENRALLNSILGIAGVPPIAVAVAPPPDTAENTFESAENARTAKAALAAEVPGVAGRVPSSTPPSPKRTIAVPRPPRMRVKPPTDAAIPMRRRSWHQIYRMLEFDSTRKESSTESSQSTVHS